MNDVTTVDTTTKTDNARNKAAAKSPHGKFQRLAVGRTKAVLKNIRLLTKMGRSPAYEYTESEAEKIIAAIEGEVAVLKRTMNEPGHQTDVEFDF